MGGRLWAKAREGGGSEFGFALRRYADEEGLALDDGLDPGSISVSPASETDWTP
jgi:hypothetical protein